MLSAHACRVKGPSRPSVTNSSHSDQHPHVCVAAMHSPDFQKKENAAKLWPPGVDHGLHTARAEAESGTSALHGLRDRYLHILWLCPLLVFNPATNMMAKWTLPFFWGGLGRDLI